jgi:hypothetical protein
VDESEWFWRGSEAIIRVYGTRNIWNITLIKLRMMAKER